MEIKSDKIEVLLYSESSIVEGNDKYISIIQILVETYDKLFGLNFIFNKSHSYREFNLLIDQFPIISYKGELIQSPEIYNFLKSYIVIESPQSEEDITIENIIQNDLQLFVNYYNYLSKDRNYLKRILRFIYQPYTSLVTMYNDYIFSKKISETFFIGRKQEVLKFINSINSKLENYLNSKGLNYCNNLNSRRLNSIDLLIYSSYKAQNKIDENIYIHIQTLVGEIDKILSGNNILEAKINRLLEIKDIYKRVNLKEKIETSNYNRFFNKGMILLFSLLFLIYNKIKKSGMSKRIIQSVEN